MGVKCIIRDLYLISVIVPLPQQLGRKDAYSKLSKSSTCLALWGPLQFIPSPQSMLNRDLAEPLAFRGTFVYPHPHHVCARAPGHPMTGSSMRGACRALHGLTSWQNLARIFVQYDAARGHVCSRPVHHS